MATIVKNLIEISGLADNLPTGIQAFKQLTLQETLELPEVKPNVKQIIKVIAQVTITNTRVIKTPVATSREGQNLTGKKLIVEGEIQQKIEYVTDDCTQSVHATHFSMPFSTFIVLDPDYRFGTPTHVTSYIENIFVEPIDNRTLFINLIILLDASD